MPENKETALPEWTRELRRRYLRGEASLFVLHGNVYDTVLHEGRQMSLTDFLVSVVLQSNKDFIGVYNVSTGFRLAYRKNADDGRKNTLAVLETLTNSHSKMQWLEALEILLTGSNIGVTSRNGLILEYAETIAPAGDPSFQADTDRAAIVTLHRWSFLPHIIEHDNIVILLAENLAELAPKIVANPRVAVIEVPLPDADAREKAISLIDNKMPEADRRRYAEITAGLKLLQITSILRPHATPELNLQEREAFITQLLGDAPDVAARAPQLAALTAEKSREEIVALLAPEKKDAAVQTAEELAQNARRESDRLIFRRKREIIERECFGLLEFIEPKFDFGAVGGLEAIKEDLRFVARNMREGHFNRVPMGLLFTGAQGTGKTFFATAFAGEAQLTAVKLKNFRSKWVGSTEGNLEKILSVIKAIGQTIVIIDEGDRAFGNSEGEGDDGTSARVIAKIKEFMSDTSNRGRVLFILMTNRPDLLDIDLKRAGRLDRKIPFFYPQSAGEVNAIAAAVSRKNSLGLAPETLAASDIWPQMVDYSAADIEAVLLLAHETAAKDAESENVNVTMEHLAAAYQDYFPSRDTTMLKFMELLAVFECSNRKLLPAKYANMSAEKLQDQLETLRLVVGNRR